MAFELFLGKLREFVFSKVATKTVDKAFGDLSNVKEFDLILKTLQKNLKSLSAKAADVEEEIKNGEVSGRKKRKRQVKEWLEEVESIKQEVVELGSQVEPGGFIMRLTDGGNATRLNEQVDKLLQQSLSFGELLLDVCGTRGEILLTNGMVGDAVNEDLEGVLKLLENRQVLSIGVYGMGGVGKTTLAKYIHNRLLQQSQGRVFWITVSQEFTIRSLQDKIARCIGEDLHDEDEEAIRAARLNRILSQMKNSVLILDDVWENVDMLKVGCTFSLECCRLIITTRSLEVCRRIGCMKVIQVVKLHSDEAWKLFNETLEKEVQLGPQVEEIAKSMAKLCGGLPLAIIVVAGSMKGEMAGHTWSNALAELKDCIAGGQGDMEEVDEVFKVLKYSFDRLNRNQGSESDGFNTIQRCFLHCSLYPEDYKIVIDDLVRKFISDGLLDERRSRRGQVEQGHSILDKLVNLCLLESCISDYYVVECVRMHDLVRSMALRIAKGKYMVRAGKWSLMEIRDEEEWTKDLEKVSSICGNLVCIREGISPDCPKLSTLLLPGNSELKVIPESFFCKMQGLCTLDLSWNRELAMLPDSLSDLTSLKSLLLEGCRMLEKVPYLGKMKALRELNLSGTRIEDVPQGLGELLNLRFLSMYALELKMLPKGVLLKLGYLQHLNLPFHILVDTEEIKGLKQLEEFGGGLKTVDDFNWFITRKGVSEPGHRVQINSSIFDSSEVEMGEVLRGKNNELVLCECNLKDAKVLGHRLAYLTIWKCEGLSKWLVDDLVERFNNPTSLKKLMVSDCGGLERILRSNHQRPQFSNTLQEIDLWYLDDLEEVVVMERGEIGPSITASVPLLVFSSLRRLTIGYCNKVQKLGLAISAVPNLEVIHIWGCGKLEEIFEQVDGRDFATTLPNLRILRLRELPRLKSVSKTTIISNSIEEIYITECPRLINKLPLHMDVPLPRGLTVIEVAREWWESLEWSINNNLPLLLLPLVRCY